MIKRLNERVAKGKEWEVSNTHEQESRSAKELAMSRSNDSDPIANAAGAAASAMFSGVMENNRKLHKKQEELLEDVEFFHSRGRPIEEIIEHTRKSLCE